MTWQEVVVRLIPTAVAAVAGFIAWREYRRKVREEIKADHRREQDRWWGIVQWCIDKTDWRNQAVDAPRLNSSLSISRGVAPPRICRGVSLSSFCTHATCSGVTVAKSVPFL